MSDGSYFVEMGIVVEETFWRRGNARRRKTHGAIGRGRRERRIRDYVHSNLTGHRALKALLARK